MLEQTTLRDGTPALVLPLLHTDRATLAEEFAKLSSESRRLRFLVPTLKLSESTLGHLVDEVDGIDHIALVLVVETDPDSYDPVALARMVRYPDVPDAADLAVTVKDDWQGRGVASALLTVLIRNRPAGVTRIVTEVFNDNDASLAMLRRLGHTKVLSSAAGVSEVEVRLDPAVPLVPITTPAGLPEVATLPMRDPARRETLRTRDQICPWLA